MPQDTCDPADNFGVQLVRTCRAEMKQLGIGGRCLGCGFYGCVYPAGYGRVAKITGDWQEYETAKWVKKQRHPMLPKIYALHKLPKECLKKTNEYESDSTQAVWEQGYAIIREDLRDVEVNDHEGLDATLIALNDSIRAENKTLRQDDLTLFEENLSMQSADDQALALEIKGFTDWAWKKGIRALDVTAENIGQRKDGSIAVRDFGSFYPRNR